MESRRRLFPTLLVNIFVSALVTGIIIFFYDQSHRGNCNTTPPVIATSPASGSEININILGIYGVGNLKDERLVIQNDGSTETELTGWQLTDNKGLVYSFPQLMLYPGAKIQIHTTSGKNTPTDLFWGRLAPVWQSGELIAFYDTHNIARAFYRVP